jgi:hypothetical protein
MGGDVANMRTKRNAYRILMVNPKERDHVEDLEVHGKIILNLTLKKQDDIQRTRFM